MIKKALKSAISAERIAQYRIERTLLTDRRKNREILFVHQMGKVGSSTLVKSLKHVEDASRLRIHYTHFLSPEGLALYEQLETSAVGGWAKLPGRKKRILTKSRILSNHLYAGEFADRSCKLISLVRDPVATNLSGFFYNNHWWPEDLVAHCRSERQGWQQALLETFLSGYPHQVPEVWFDWELKGVFGIDIFTTLFDQSAGYQIYQAANYPLLLIRLENLQELTVETISGFLGLKSFKLKRSNVAGEKWYGDLYRKFKASVELPPSYLDQMYGGRAVRHFYSPVEIERFRAKWENA